MITAISGLGVCATLLLTKPLVDKPVSQYSFVLAELNPPVSLDPLDADFSNNLHASQMVYRTPLEIDEDGALRSGLLRSFSYDPHSALITFEVDGMARFSDGSPIKAVDLEFAIRRMAAKRPSFPVLRHVLGIHEWAAGPLPLSSSPAGLSVVGQKVRIQLVRHVHNPLFRFALPLFGVVKRSCVDMDRNKLAGDCPTSGYYRLAQRAERTLTFVRTDDVAIGRESLPPVVEIRYLADFSSMNHRAATRDQNVVILRQESAGEASDEDSPPELIRVEQPNARFSALLLNPRTPGLDSALCRRRFAHAVRRHLLHASARLQVEASLFSRILPGYLSQEALEQPHAIDYQTLTPKCANPKQRPLRWLPSKTAEATLLQPAVEAAAAEMGFILEQGPEMSGPDLHRAFLDGRVDLLMGGSGFWAFDPVGDVQMLFTRGLHKPLHFVTEDPVLQALINDLEFEDNPVPRLQRINRHLFEQALLNVYSHSKRVYFTRGDSVSRKIPIAVTPPAPWQLFKADDCK